MYEMCGPRADDQYVVYGRCWRVLYRMASARAKAEQAQQAAVKAQSDAEKGRQKAYSYDPNFVQPGAFSACGRFVCI